MPENARNHAPDAARRKQHEHDGEPAEQHQIPGAERRQVILQQIEYRDADDRALHRADAADDDDEDDIGGPVDQRERGVRRNPGLLQKDQRADHAGGDSGQDIDQEFGAEDIDAGALRSGFGIADGGQRQAVARAQQPVHQDESADGKHEREPIGHDVARRRTAHRKQLAHKIEAADRARRYLAAAKCRCRRPVASPAPG